MKGMTRKKQRLLGILLILALLVVTWFSLPHYARQALIHLMPVIDDLETFQRDTVRHDAANVRHWPRAKAYNRYQLPADDAAYLDSLHTSTPPPRPSSAYSSASPWTKGAFIASTTPCRAIYLPILKDDRPTSPCATSSP